MPNKSEPGDIIITGKNFGSGSSRQQAVDCFRSLENQAILAESFGAIYERNAINAGFPVLTYTRSQTNLNLKNRDTVVIDLEKGTITNKRNSKTASISQIFRGTDEQFTKAGIYCLTLSDTTFRVIGI